MKLFSGSANKPLAEKVAKELHVQLSPVEVHVFPDGEKRIRITEPVGNEHAVVMQSAATPVDQNYMELFFIVDALKRNGAESVTAVVPYFGYQRQDHVFREGEAVSLEVVIKIIETVGVDRFISIDLHSVNIPQLFHIPVANLSALPLFADTIKQHNWNTDGTILISPDKGGLRGITRLSELLDNKSYIVCNKKRDMATGKISYDPIDKRLLKHTTRAIILDDMISSGNTILAVLAMLQKHSIAEIYVFVTHAIFSSNAPHVLQSSALTKLFVADTVFMPKEKLFPKLAILSVADIIARELKNLNS